MFYLSGVCASPPPGEAADKEVSENNHTNPNKDSGTSSNMTQRKNITPSLAELEDSLAHSGFILTKKNAAYEEKFMVEIQKVYHKGYLPVNPLLALPVCWASAKLLPDPDRERNLLIFDDEDSDGVDATVVLAFPKVAQSLRTPVIIDVHRCCRIPLPPKPPAEEREDALLIFSWSCDQEQISPEKNAPDRYTTL